jgi:hypothetical protein
LKNNKTYRNRIQKFRKKYKLKKRDAHLKFILFPFVECLNAVSKEFVFKGGNLVWYYIKTPRATVDVDVVTLSNITIKQVLDFITKACEVEPGFGFRIKRHRAVPITKRRPFKGVRIWLEYNFENMKNVFFVDIVINLKTDFHLKKIPPLYRETKIATLESIVSDKLRAVFRFATGNTRMKDFDDLYRICKEKKKLDLKKIAQALKDYPNIIPAKYISELSTTWKRYKKEYDDLPDSFRKVVNVINQFLKTLK